MDDTNPPRPKPRRRLLKVAVALTLLIIVGVGTLPWLISSSPGRAIVVGRINSTLAPGSVTLSGLSLGWTSPVQLTGFSLRDPAGKVVVAAKSIRMDRGILGLLTSRPNYGTITVEDATIDVVRKADGSIDLMQAIESATKSDPKHPSKPRDPKTAVVIQIQSGTLRVASPELVEPVKASRLEGSMTLTPGQPMALVVKLADEGRSLAMNASMGSTDPADRSVKIAGQSWPIHIREAGVEVQARFDGNLEATEKAGLWSVQGDSALVGLDASGPSLKGDRLTFDRVSFASDMVQSATGWSVRKLELTCPIASLSASGSWPATEGARLQGQADLAALTRLLPHATHLKDGLTLEKGMAKVRGELTVKNGVERFELTAGLDDLAAQESGRAITLREPAHLTASISRASGKITIEALEVKAAGVDVRAGGDLEAGVKLEGTVDLATLNAQARDFLDLGALGFAGQARMAADYRHTADTYQVRFGADCKDLVITGPTAEPIHRDLTRIDLSATGPRAPDGRPTGWLEARVDLKSADLKLGATVTHQKDEIAVLAAAGVDVASPTPGRFEVKASVTTRGRAFEIDDLRAGITPTDPNAALGSVALALRGNLDLATGQGKFEPIPGVAVGAFGLGAEGLRLEGLGQTGHPMKVNGTFVGDLAALDRLLAAWSGSPSKGLAGLWGTKLTIERSAAGHVQFDSQVDVANITAPGLNGPVSMTAKADYSPDKDRIDIAAISLATEFGNLSLAGNVVELKTRKFYDLRANFEPRWEAIDPIITASLEPKAKFRAKVRPIQWKGWWEADSTPRRLSQQVAEIGLDVTVAQAFGVTLGATPVVLKIGGGGAVLDTIQTTINGGAIQVVGRLAFDDEYGVWVKLERGTRIETAAINDDVSRSVLAFIAPVLAQSTEVNGKVSVDLARAYLPITATKTMVIDGAVVFQDVEFRPGPLGAQIASITGQSAPKLQLHQPMQLSVADGRVKQSGLSIPLGSNIQVAMDGSVGFDKTLDLTVSVPLTSKMLGVDARFDKAVGGSKLTIPIKGTMSKPVIDRQALTLAIRDAAKAAIGRGLESEASGLLERVAGPNPTGGEPKGKPGRTDPLNELENLGRGLLEKKKP